MDVATLVLQARRRSGLTQRELAARAGTSAGAVCQYERGDRIPRVDTLQRLVTAAGSTLSLEASAPPPIDMAVNGRDLEAVLGLADLLPQRNDPELRFPLLSTLLDRR